MLQGIGLIAVTLGIIGIIWGIFQKIKAGRVSDAPLVSTGDAANRGREVGGPKGQISAQGNLVCQQPLIAPFSGTPCLYYKIKCTAEWKDGDENKSKVIDEQKMAAQFGIDDGSGVVWVDAREGGDFEPTTTKRDTKGTGLLGGITGADIDFGNYRVSTGILSLGTKYTVEEEVMPMVPRVYACGRVGDQPGVIIPPGWRSLILSAKSRDELLSSATKTAKISLIAGAAAFVVGGGLATIGQLTSHDDDDAPKAAASVATSATVISSAVVSAAPSAAAPPSASVAAAASVKPPAAKAGVKPTTTKKK